MLAGLLLPAAANAQTDRRVLARTSGGDRPTAVAIATRLLAREWPAQVLRVRCERTRAAHFCGIIVSAVKFHQRLDMAGFREEIAALVHGAMTAGPPLAEIDVWATVPASLRPNLVAPGDFAPPPTATVFTLIAPNGTIDERNIYWDAAFRADLAKGTRE